jgi:hypothetical protein
MTDKPRLTVVPSTGTTSPSTRGKAVQRPAQDIRRQDSSQQRRADNQAGSVLHGHPQRQRMERRIPRGIRRREHERSQRPSRSIRSWPHTPRLPQRLERAEREKQQNSACSGSHEQSVSFKSWSRSHCVMVTLTAHKCGRWNFWARRWACSSTWRPRTRRHEMLMQCGLNWKHG